MALKIWNNERIYDDDINGNFVKASYQMAALNLIRELIDREVDLSADGTDFYGEAYTDSDGRLNSVDIFLTTAAFDIDKYKMGTLPSGTEPYVIIEATNISSNSDFEINDCIISSIAVGRWVLFCNTGTDEEKRAKIYKTLFYGTNGSNPRASSTYITNITALKTSVSRDVGKSGFYVKASGSSPFEYEGTFSDTSSNTHCSAWSNTSHTNNGECDFYFPSSTKVNYTLGTSSHNEIGLNRTSDENDNPTSCKIYNSQYTATGVAVIISSGSISWTINSGTPTVSNTDFLTDNGIPLFADGSTEDFDSAYTTIYHTIPSGTFPANTSNAYLKAMYADWEDGCSTQFKLLNYDNFDSSTAITNGNFEDSIGSEWTETSGVGIGERVTDKVKDGSYSYKISESGSLSNTEVARIEQTVCTTDWYKIKFSNWMNIHEGSVKLQIYIDSILIYSREVVKNSGTTNDSVWTDVEADINSNARLSSATLLIKVQGTGCSTNGRSSSTWIDNFIVNRRPLKDDSGWLTEGELNTFTSFTIEPTTCIVKLIPATGGTVGYPSIKGIAYRGTD